MVEINHSNSASLAAAAPTPPDLADATAWRLEGGARVLRGPLARASRASRGRLAMTCRTSGSSSSISSARPRPSPIARAFISSFPRKREPRAPGPRRSPWAPAFAGATEKDHLAQHGNREQSRRPHRPTPTLPSPACGGGLGRGLPARLVGTTTLRVRPTPERPLSPCVISSVSQRPEAIAAAAWRRGGHGS
jgi:hypothetical protein